MASLLLSPALSGAACTGSSPLWISTVDYASVNICVSQATAGDSILVSSGTATWNSTLSVTKGVSLIGAGSDTGGSVIINGGGAARTLIYYNADTSDDDLFRVSGFRFIMGGGGSVFELDCRRDSGSVDQTKIRIDHNYAENNRLLGDNGGFFGTNDCFGVVDNNELVDVRSPFRFWGDDSGNETSWDREPAGKTQGGSKYLYIEDNTISGIDNTYMVLDADENGSWAIRYNTISFTTANQSNYFDMHPTCMSLESYGNRLNATTGNNLISWRGGKALSFYNNIDGSTWENYAYNNDGPYPASIMGHNNGYLFGSRINTDGSLVDFAEGPDDVNTITEDVTYWTDNTTETGSIQTYGVRCGPDRTAVTSCTKGVAFWETFQSCTDLTGLTGDINTYPNRSTITGTLYKCGAANNWVAHYTPYTYPHPLRGESIAKRPSSPTNLSGTLQEN
jgi:hypothetical protein